MGDVARKTCPSWSVSVTTISIVLVVKGVDVKITTSVPSVVAAVSVVGIGCWVKVLSGVDVVIGTVLKPCEGSTSPGPVVIRKKDVMRSGRGTSMLVCGSALTGLPARYGYSVPFEVDEINVIDSAPPSVPSAPPTTIAGGVNFGLLKDRDEDEETMAGPSG